MPFRFRLAKVLKVRERVLEQRTRDVAAADRARQVCLERENRLAAAYADLAAIDPAVAGRALDVRDLADHSLRLKRLGEQRRAAARQTDLATAELEVQRARLTEAWRDAEVLRKLEARRREQWEEEQRRRDGRLMDEVGGIRADRLRRSKVSA
jgi:flagellar export protein FliJ